MDSTTEYLQEERYFARLQSKQEHIRRLQTSCVTLWLLFIAAVVVAIYLAVRLKGAC